VGSDSIQKRKHRGWLLVIGSALLLTGLVVASVFLGRKEPEDDRFVRLWDPSTREQMTEQERQDLLRQWKELDPETRKRASQVVFHQAVDRFREEFGKRSNEEQRAWVDAEVTRMQERFQSLTRDERSKIDERLRTDEAKTYLKNVFSTYHQELSAHERAVLEPLAKEFMVQLETFN
jgi:hypothetical protein